MITGSNSSTPAVPAPAGGDPGLRSKEVIPEPTSSKESHFRTDHLLTNLGGRAASGGMVTAGAQIVKFALYMASAIVFARLLTPQDFGLVAMVTALSGFLRMFKDAGLSTATVQKENITHAQVSNLFWINVALCSFITLAFAAMAPAVAWFYRESRLVLVTVILSSTFILSGLTVQHLAILNRQMRFKAIAIIDIASMAVSLIVGVAAALSGWGYWALVASQIALSLTEVIATWGASSWRPQWPRRREGTRTLVNFGASLTLSNFVRRLSAGADALLIGRYFGADALGLYSRAVALLARPLDQFINPFDVVFVPLLSRLQAQPERYRRTYLQVYGLVALLSFPFAGLLLALSHPIVILLLGARWEAVIPIFAAFSLAALFIPMGYASMWLLTTQGRSRDLLKAGFTFSAISLVLVLVGLPFGLVGVALASSVGGLLIRLPAQYFIVGRSGPVSTADLWKVFFKYLPFWVVVVATASIPLSLWPEAGPFWQTLLGVISGFAGAAALAGIVPTYRRDLVDLIELAKKVKKSRASNSADESIGS